MDRVGRLLTRRLRMWLVKTSLRAASRVEIGPFYVYAESHPSHDVIGSIRVALHLIERVDPRRYERLRLEAPNLLLVRAGGGAIYSNLRTASLEYRIVNDLSTPEFAAYLVELAARARIANAPFAGRLTPSHRRRIWRRAILEQIAFLKRLPNSELIGVEGRIQSLRESIHRA